MFGNIMGGKGLRTRTEDDKFEGFDADVYVVVNVSTIELPAVERFVAEKANGRGLHSSTFQVNLSRVGHTSACPPV